VCGCVGGCAGVCVGGVGVCGEGVGVCVYHTLYAFYNF